MRVEGYQVSLTSSWQEKESLVIEEKLEVRSGRMAGGVPVGQGLAIDKLEISAAALNRGWEAGGYEEVDDSEVPPELQEKARIVALLVEIFTGRKLELKKIRIKGSEEKAGKGWSESPAVIGRAGQGWGLSYDYRCSYREEETASFSGRGVVKTGDGRVLGFDFDLVLSRSFAAEERISLRLGQAAVDPLVISFDGEGLRFTDEPWLFDLNGDGVAERLASLASGSGFLVLDKNGDGSVNNGREMFGPSTGDGWAELAAYDSDGNGWIDEADPVFCRLQVLVRQGNTEVLFSLADLSVGAIFLGRVATPFSFRSAANADLAFLRSGGIYLKENGQPGFIGRVDLVDIKV